MQSTRTLSRVEPRRKNRRGKEMQEGPRQVPLRGLLNRLLLVAVAKELAELMGDMLLGEVHCVVPLVCLVQVSPIQESLCTLPFCLSRPSVPCVARHGDMIFG